MENCQGRIKISYLPGLDVVVINNLGDTQLFITTNDSIIIGRSTLINLINYMVKYDIVSKKIIYGILEGIEE